MAIDERAPRRRNALTWTAASFVVLLVYSFGMSALIQDGPVVPLSEAGPVIALIAASLLAGSVLVGFSFRDKPFNLRSLAGFIVVTALTVAAFALARWALADTVPLEALGPSLAVPLVFGAVLVVIAVMGLLFAAAAHVRPGVLPSEQAELLREQGRVLPYSYIAIAAMGLVLVLLSLAAPGGPLAPGMALAGVVVMLGIETAVTLAIWPQLDELSQTLSRETGNAAFYLIIVLGGGWAILAHLGFVPAPAPIDWVTMLTVLMLAASIIATARRGLLRQEAGTRGA
jgi:hypothetical protein